MKSKIKVLLLVMAMACVCLAGCGKKEGTVTTTGQKGESDKLKVVTTIFAPYDFSRQIAGEDAKITMLLPPASETHTFEPTPQDIINIQNCDVFVYIGGESDSWIEDVLKDIDTSKIKVIPLMKEVDLLEEETVEGMQEEEHEHEHEHEHDGEEHQEEEYDEHIWTSPKNSIKIVEKLQQTFMEVDEANKDDYKKNGDSYIAELEELDAKFQNVVEHAERKTIVFGDRFPLRYFAEEYGLDYYAAFPGCAEDTEPSASTIAFLIDKVKEEKIPVVYHLELSNEKMADTICESTGAKKLLFHACHNISKEDFENGVTYVELMEKNVETLQEALN